MERAEIKVTTRGTHMTSSKLGARFVQMTAFSLCAAMVALTAGCEPGSLAYGNGNANGSGNGNANDSTNANDNAPDAGNDVSFAGDIQPIFTTACAGCHSSGGAADLAGIALMLTEGEAYDLLINVPSVQDTDLTLVVPGDPDASLLLAKVESDEPPVGLRMPRFAPALSDDEIALIRSWIEQGADNN